MEQGDVAIEIVGLTKVYKIFERPADRLKEAFWPGKRRWGRDFYALREINLTIGRGENIGFIGRNGAGKSTILKLITGVLTPTAGSIRVSGRIASLLELGAGFNPEMTGRENIYLSGALMGYSPEQMEERLPKIAAFADIGDFLEQPVKSYSSGMFARLAFAVNSYVEPDILIVDEALSVGDIAFQMKCITRMRQMADAGVTILFVTHDMGVVKSFCERCVYLEQGAVKEIGPAAEVADDFLRDMREEMNEAHGPAEGTAAPPEAALPVDTPLESGEIPFVRDEGFASRVASFRQGTGKVRFTAFQFLDMAGQPLQEATFDQKARLRFFVEYQEEATAGFGYHIRDDKGVELVGAYTPLEEHGLCHGQAGDCFIVDFVTRLPLMQGAYNIELVATQPLDIAGNTAIFHDMIENAAVFTMEPRSVGRIWDKVYLPVDYQVKRAQ